IVKNEDILTNMMTFIKHAIKGSPIIDKKEKINDVMSKIKKLNRWTAPQKTILERIEKYLENNEILTEDDLETSQFKQYGGYNRIDKQLDGMLNEIISILKQDLILN
ncbi:type I restriction-modification enzyme R subunit C-terminal domain-containing protein, partial [Cetobacterium sp.]|uniref:type I restriction-modification enzyme R subunit C-terminal domain-containing protein n=1 Tax=Cetobacterium sp. TaxID=2071632 RepID=UPI003AEF80CB